MSGKEPRKRKGSLQPGSSAKKHKGPTGASTPNYQSSYDVKTMENLRADQKHRAVTMNRLTKLPIVLTNIIGEYSSPCVNNTATNCLLYPDYQFPDPTFGGTADCTEFCKNKCAEHLDFLLHKWPQELMRRIEPLNPAIYEIRYSESKFEDIKHEQTVDIFPAFGGIGFLARIADAKTNGTLEMLRYNTLKQLCNDINLDAFKLKSLSLSIKVGTEVNIASLNGLIRQYLPESDNFVSSSDDFLSFTFHFDKYRNG